MSYENESFDKAAANADIRGRDHKGNKALDDFSSYYHNKWDKWEREGHGYNRILEIAEDWWRENRSKYS